MINKEESIALLEEALRDSGCALHSVGQLIEAAVTDDIEDSGWLTVKLDYEVRVKSSWIIGAML
jgi:hypothetical protein